MNRQHIKFGIHVGSKTTIDDTLRVYRRLYSNIKIEKLLYFNNLKALKDFESCFNRLCEKNKSSLGHEQLIEINMSDLLEKLNSLISLLSYEDKFIFATQKDIDSYNNGL